MLIDTEGIVLRQQKIPGNRRMLTLFTKRYGRISAGTSINEKGKGKSALALRPFTYAEYEIFKNRGYYNINYATVKRSYYGIGEDLDRYFAASKVLEYLDQVLQEEKAEPRLFDLVLEFMDALQDAEGDCTMVLYAFIVKTFPLMGIKPELRQCANCGKPVEKEGPHHFSIDAGGVLCEDCFDVERKGEEVGENASARGRRDRRELLFTVDFDIVGVLQYFGEKPFRVFDKVSLKPEYREQIRRIISIYVSYYLNIDILDEKALI